jgi:hypothetical protein
MEENDASDTDEEDAFEQIKVKIPEIQDNIDQEFTYQIEIDVLISKVLETMKLGYFENSKKQI